MTYTIFDTTADIGITAAGGTPHELVKSLIAGLYAVAYGTDTALPKEPGEPVHVSGDDFEHLVFSVLEEALFRLYAKGEALVMKRVDETTASFSAVPRPPDTLAVEIKAVTRHRFSVEHPSAEQWTASCVLDV